MLLSFEKGYFMSWVLFCQIEVILLTIGLVAAFVITAWQRVKDRSFYDRTSTLCKAAAEAVESLTKKMPKKEKGQHNDE